jgi:hypothetical protein
MKASSCLSSFIFVLALLAPAAAHADGFTFAYAFGSECG